jgi:hypothetical protein
MTPEMRFREIWGRERMFVTSTFLELLVNVVPCQQQSKIDSIYTKVSEKECERMKDSIQVVYSLLMSLP